jgi:hypothetical protein
MLSKGESLSAGEVARNVGQYQDIRANLPDDQWFGVSNETSVRHARAESASPRMR